MNSLVPVRSTDYNVDSIQLHDRVQAGHGKRQFGRSPRLKKKSLHKHGVNREKFPSLSNYRVMQSLVPLDAKCVRLFGSSVETLCPFQQLLAEHGFCDPVRLVEGRLRRPSFHGRLAHAGTLKGSITSTRMNETIVRVTRNPDDLVPILITRTENLETVCQGRIEALDLTVR
jgi:hypothetical protein